MMVEPFNVSEVLLWWEADIWSGCGITTHIGNPNSRAINRFLLPSDCENGYSWEEQFLEGERSSPDPRISCSDCGHSHHCVGELFEFS